MPPKGPPLQTLSKRQYSENHTREYYFANPVLFIIILAVGVVVIAIAISIAVKLFRDRKKRKRALHAQILGVGNYHYVPGRGGGGAVVPVPYPGAPQAAPPVAGEVRPRVDLRPIRGYYAPAAPAPARDANAATAAAKTKAPPMEGYLAPAAPAPVVLPAERNQSAAKGTVAGLAGPGSS